MSDTATLERPDAADRDGSRPDDKFRPVISRARAAFRRAQAYESTARARWLSDWKFANGDDENNYQWPADVYNGRMLPGQERPTLTINKTRQHNLMIANEAKQNKQGIKYRPVGDGATRAAADVWEGLARHIQNISHFQDQAGRAIDFQVGAGLGWTWIDTDYVGDDTFDQEIYIRGIDDPLSVYLVDATEPDGSDAKKGFIFKDRPRDEMEAEYPWLKGMMSAENVIGSEDSGWIRDDTIREAIYYERTATNDELLMGPNGTTMLRSKLTPELIKAWGVESEADDGKLKRRKVVRHSVHKYKIVGDRVVDDSPWAGTTIPIIPWVGQETVIDGQLDRKGHTRYLKSAQQMFNYNRSAAVEYGALQSKSPFMGPMAAFRGFETYYDTANQVNHAWLPYNHVDENDKDLPPPQRAQPPQSAPAFLEGAQSADNDMMLASGQYQAELGAPGNEISGKAIGQRQRQGDRATYHFTDQQAIAVRRHGSIIKEIAPKIYDTERVIRILGEDGTESHVQIDPTAEQAHAPMPGTPPRQPGQANAVAAIFNPNVGRFEVVADVGPDYATQRQEAFDAMVQIITQAPELLPKIGDLLFMEADFPLADQIAERLKPGLSPEAQQAVDQLTQQLQKAQQAGANLQKLLGEAMQGLAEERLKNKAKDSDTVIDAFDADTRRLAALKDALVLDPGMLRLLATEVMRQSAQDNLGPATEGAAQGINLQLQGLPPPGAAGQMPIRSPDVGQQAATPGGM